MTTPKPITGTARVDRAVATTRLVPTPIDLAAAVCDFQTDLDAMFDAVKAAISAGDVNRLASSSNAIDALRRRLDDLDARQAAHGDAGSPTEGLLVVNRTGLDKLADLLVQAVMAAASAGVPDYRGELDHLRQCRAALHQRLDELQRQLDAYAAGGWKPRRLDAYRDTHAALRYWVDQFGDHILACSIGSGARAEMVLDCVGNYIRGLEIAVDYGQRLPRYLRSTEVYRDATGR